jgi:hypothetical protein
MAENKTQPTAVSVDDFLAAVPDERRRTEGAELRALMERVTGEPATMWGPSIIGFGKYRYRYASGREGDAPRVAFSPRKADLVLYVGAGWPEQAEHLARVGKHRLGKSCLYLKRLSDANLAAIEAMVRTCYARSQAGEISC